jgi:hypothetical protein
MHRAITLMMKAICISEMLVYFNEATQQHIAQAVIFINTSIQHILCFFQKFPVIHPSYPDSISEAPKAKMCGISLFLQQLDRIITVLEHGTLLHKTCWEKKYRYNFFIIVTYQGNRPDDGGSAHL